MHSPELSHCETTCSPVLGTEPVIQFFTMPKWASKFRTHVLLAPVKVTVDDAHLSDVIFAARRAMDAHDMKAGSQKSRLARPHLRSTANVIAGFQDLNQA